VSIAKCQSCGASIIWSRTVNGKLVALDPLPVRIAMRIVRDDGEGAVDFKQGNTVHLDTCTKQRATQRTTG
jgi:hypothetical protein